MHRELLGASLPHSTAGWCFAFLAILGGVSILLMAVEQFVERFNGRKIGLRPLAGLALPASWIIWSASMIYWRCDPTTGLVAVAGLVLIIAIRVLTNRR